LVNPYPPIVLSFSIAFLIVYLATPRVIHLFRAKRLTTPDVHKPGNPQVPCLGGLVVIAGLVPAYIGGALMFGVDRYSITIFPLIILLIGMIGLVDYLIDPKQRTKVLLCLAAGLPLALTFSGDTNIYTPIITLKLGLLYYVAIPLIIAAAANLANMLAGYNGLEAGLGSMTATTMLASAVLMRQWGSAVMMASLLGALAAFLPYNRYPARIFLSDVGTLSIGAVVAVAAITGKMEVPLLICMIPHIVDFFMKMSVRFGGRRIYGDSRLNPDCTLNPPPYPSLPHVFLRRKRLDEPGLVKVMLLLEGVFCVIALLFVIVQAAHSGLP